MSLEGQTRYRLRDDAFFVKTEDGVWIRNNRGSFSISGRSAYPLVKLLFARLQAETTVDELCGGVGPQQRNAIEGVVRKLDQYGFVRRVAHPREEIPGWARALYDDQIRFIDHHVDDPFARFLEFRTRRIVCTGCPTLARAAVTALAEFGAGQVLAVPDETSGPAHEALVELAAAAVARDPRVSFAVKPNAPADAAAHPPRDCTILLASAPEGLAAQLERAAAGTPAIVAALYRVGEQLVVSSPLAADAGVCLECVYRAVGAGAAPDADPLPVPPIAASLAASQLVFELFATMTGVPREQAPVVRTVDCHTLTVKVHHVQPHPMCRRHGSVAPAPAFTSSTGATAVLRPDLPRAVDPPELVQAQDEITAIVGRWTGPVAGPLLRAAEGDLPQVPLAASECAVRGVRPGRADQDHVTICRALSTREARNQAVLYALEWLTGELLEGRREAVLGGPRTVVAIGAGWSADEAAYRALVHLSLSLGRPGPEPTRQDGGAEGELRDSRIGEYLLSLVADRAPGPLWHSIARAATGLHVAAVSPPGGPTGRGAGATPLNARLNALMDLADRLVAGTTGGRPALLSFGLRSWAESLAAPAAPAGARAGQPIYRNLGHLLPFARENLHLVAAELADAG